MARRARLTRRGKPTRKRRGVVMAFAAGPRPPE
jgi:hypothetical protein